MQSKPNEAMTPAAQAREIEEAVRVAVDKHEPDDASSIDMQHDEHMHGGGGDDDDGMHELPTHNDVPLKRRLPLSHGRRWPLYALRRAYRDYFAEFFGTFILILFGNGSSATVTLAPKSAYGDYMTNATWLAVTIGWGLAVTMGLYVSMGTSGGHLNPAVTFANAVFGNFPWRKAPGYMLAQLLGAMLGAACVYAMFRDHFAAHEAALVGGQTMTSTVGGIFCTYPKVSNGYATLNELIETAVLLMVIFGITDERMTPATAHKPIAVGLLVVIIGLATGWNTAYAINPARDLGPRIVTAMLWGSEPFTLYSYYFVIPLFVPFVGALLGTFLYVFFVIPDEKDE